MAVTYQNAGGHYLNGAVGGAVTDSYAFDVGTGANRAIAMLVTLGDNIADTTSYAIDVTYAGVSLIDALGDGGHVIAGSPHGKAKLFYLLNPAPGSNTLAITTGNSGGTGEAITSSVVAVNGAGGVANAAWHDDGIGTTGNTLSITNSVGGMVVGLVAHGDTSLTIDSPLTQRNVTIGDGSASMNNTGAGTLASTGSPIAINASSGLSDHWAIHGLEFTPVVTGGVVRLEDGGEILQENPASIPGNAVKIASGTASPGTGSWNTGALSLVDGDLIIAHSHAIDAGGGNIAANLVASDGTNGSYAVIGSGGDPGPNRQQVAGFWVKNVGTGSRTVTFDCGASNVLESLWVVWRIPAANWDGSTAPINGFFYTASIATNGSVSGTLSLAPNIGDITVASVAVDSGAGTTGVNPGADFTEDVDVPLGAETYGQGQHRKGSISTTVNWANIQTGSAGNFSSSLAGTTIRGPVTGSPSFISIGADHPSTTSPINVAVPAGLAGDFLVMFWESDQSADQAVASGWTQGKTAIYTGLTHVCGYLYKFDNTTGGGTQTVTGITAGGTFHEEQILRYRGVDTNNPIGASDIDIGTGGVARNLTTILPDSVEIVMVNDDSGIPGSPVAPAGFGARSPTSAANFWVGDRMFTRTGQTGSSTWPHNSVNSAMLHLTLNGVPSSVKPREHLVLEAGVQGSWEGDGTTLDETAGFNVTQEDATDLLYERLSLNAVVQENGLYILTEAGDHILEEISGGGATRSINDAAAGTDAITRSLVLARSITDAAGGTETLTRVNRLTRAITDTASGSDSITTRIATHPRAITDTGAGTDAVTRTLVLANRAITDTASGTDAVTRTLVQTRAITDTASGTDAVTRSRVSTRSITDTGAGSDALTRSLVLARSITDTAAGTDATTQIAGKSRSITDSAAGTDTLVRTLVLARSINDSGAGSETLTRALSFSRAITDSAPATDVAARVCDFSDDFNRANGAIGSGYTNVTANGESVPQINGNKLVPTSSSDFAGSRRTGESYRNTQTASMSYTPDPAGTLWQADVVARGDVASGDGYFAQWDDASGGSYSIYKQVSFTQTTLGTTLTGVGTTGTRRLTIEAAGTTINFFVDGVLKVTATDSAIASGYPGFSYFGNFFTGGFISADDFCATGVTSAPQSRPISDSASGVDTVARSLSLPRAITDAASGTDAVTRTRVSTRSVSDTAAGTDAVTRTLIDTRSITDAANGTDAVTRTRVSTRTVTDTASGTDAITRTLVLARSITDTAAGTDAITSKRQPSRSIVDSAAGSDTTTRLLVQTRSITDSAPTSENLVASKGPTRFINDNAPATETITRSLVLALRALTDAAVGTDAVVRTRVSTRSISDSAAGTDTVTRSATKTRAISDSASGTDTVTRSPVIVRAIGDSAFGSDTVTRTLRTFRSISDSAPATDVARRVFLRFITDSAPASDVAVAVYLPTTITLLPIKRLMRSLIQPMTGPTSPRTAMRAQSTADTVLRRTTRSMPAADDNTAGG